MRRRSRDAWHRLRRSSAETSGTTDHCNERPFVKRLEDQTVRCAHSVPKHDDSDVS